MDGAKFDIEINAKSLGVDASVGQLVALANGIKQTDTVATSFDTAVRAASKSLEGASAAAKLAADGLSTAEKKYGELEKAADQAAKAVEKAGAAGKDTKDLAAAALSAKAKMLDQGKAVDALREKSKLAAAAQTELSDTLGILKGKQSAATNEIKKAKPAAEDASSSSGGLAAALGAVEGAALLVAAAVIGAVIALGSYAVASNPAATARLSRAMTRLQLGFKNLFTGLKLDKFVSGLEDVMSLFDKGTSSANGMKVLIETIFQPLFDGAAKALPFVKEMFKGMIHGALLAVIAVLEIRNAIFKAMSPETRAWIKSMVDKVFTLHNAFLVGTAIAVVFAVTIGLVVVALLLMLAPIAAVAVAILNWGTITEFLKAKFQQFVIWLTDLWDKTVGKALDFGKNIAANIIAGLTGGLAAGGPATKDAMDKILAQAKTGAAAALDSHSPSRVYAKLGATIPQGLAMGIDAGTPDVHGALESMTTPVDASEGASVAPTAGAAAPAGATSTTTKTIHIAQLTIGDSPVAKSTFEDFKRAVMEVMEGASLTIGGGEAPAT